MSTSLLQKSYFLNDAIIGNILMFNRISSGEKIYKYFIFYLDKNKIKSFRIILQKTSVYLKGWN